MKSGVFITGTDTGIGKTFVTALLLAELRRRGVRAAAFKPIACGDSGRADAKLYALLMDGELSVNEVNPIWLRKPLAPWVAARRERRKITLRRVFTRYQSLISNYDFVLVEGVGGWLVPIKRDYFVRDFARDLNLPVLIVARPGLGTLNHTLLTVESIRAAKLEITALILNHAASAKSGLVGRTNVSALRDLTGLPIFSLPFSGRNLATRAGIQRALQPSEVRSRVGNILEAVRRE